MTIKVWRRGDLEKMLLLVKGAVGFYESILKDMDEFGINRIMINGGTNDTRFVEACSDMIKKSCDEADIGIKAAIQGNDRRSWRTQYRTDWSVVRHDHPVQTQGVAPRLPQRTGAQSGDLHQLST